MMTGIPIENNLWTAYLLTIFFVVAGPHPLIGGEHTGKIFI